MMSICRPPRLNLSDARHDIACLILFSLRGDWYSVNDGRRRAWFSKPMSLSISWETHIAIQLSHLTLLFLASITYYYYFMCQCYCLHWQPCTYHLFEWEAPVVSQVSHNTSYSTSVPDGNQLPKGEKKGVSQIVWHYNYIVPAKIVLTKKKM